MDYCIVRSYGTNAMEVRRVAEVLRADSNKLYKIPCSLQDVIRATKKGDSGTLRTAFKDPDSGRVQLHAVAILKVGKSVKKLEGLIRDWGNAKGARSRVPKKIGHTPNMIPEHAKTSKECSKEEKIAAATENSLKTKVRKTTTKTSNDEVVRLLQSQTNSKSSLQKNHGSASKKKSPSLEGSNSRSVGNFEGQKEKNSSKRPCEENLATNLPKKVVPKNNSRSMDQEPENDGNIITKSSNAGEFRPLQMQPNLKSFHRKTYGSSSNKKTPNLEGQNCRFVADFEGQKNEESFKRPRERNQAGNQPKKLVSENNTRSRTLEPENNNNIPSKFPDAAINSLKIMVAEKDAENDRQEARILDLEKELERFRANSSMNQEVLSKNQKQHYTEELRKTKEIVAKKDAENALLEARINDLEEELERFRARSSPNREVPNQNRDRQYTELLQETKAIGKKVDNMAQVISEKGPNNALNEAGMPISFATPKDGFVKTPRGVKIKSIAIINAMGATSMRKRANHVVDGYWWDKDVRDRMTFFKTANKENQISDEDVASILIELSPDMTMSIHTVLFSALGVCQDLQVKKPLNSTGKSDPELNLRAWISAKLRSDKNRRKSKNHDNDDKDEPRQRNNRNAREKTPEHQSIDLVNRIANQENSKSDEDDEDEVSGEDEDDTTLSLHYDF